MSFELHFLGTGDAFNTGGRGSACLHAEAFFESASSGNSPSDPANRFSFLVDLGPTAIQAMIRERRNPGDVDAVFVTHLHGDHIAGWPFFLLHNAIATPRRRPLDVYGATGTRERLSMLATLCYGDVLKPERLVFEIRYHELDVLPADGIVTTSSLHFDTIPMDHDATSIGYRFHAGPVRTAANDHAPHDRHIAAFAVSGDTRWCPALRDLAAGCDLLILECTTVKRQVHAHISLEDLRERRGELDAPRVLLVHTSDPVAEALAKESIDGVQVAEDGMSVDHG